MENLIGKKAKVVDGFETHGYFSGTHQFKEGEVITLSQIEEEGEVWYYFVDEDGFQQILIESEFEFIKEDGE